MIGRIDTGGATFSTNALVFGTDKTGFKPIVYMGHPSATGTDSTAVLGLGVFRNTEAITSLQVMSDGTFDAGTVYIYGAA